MSGQALGAVLPGVPDDVDPRSALAVIKIGGN